MLKKSSRRDFVTTVEDNNFRINYREGYLDATLKAQSMKELIDKPDFIKIKNNLKKMKR
jgi:hypothetical protein